MRSNISSKMQKFRRRSRSLWDITLGDFDADIELTEPFLQFRKLLFWTLVAGDWTEASIRENDPLIRSTIGLREGEVRVEAISELGLEITLNQVAGAMSGNWRREPVHVDTSTSHVCMIDLFDWDEQSGMDHEFYLVKVMTATDRADLAGFYGIVRPQECQLFWEAPPSRRGQLK